MIRAVVVGLALGMVVSSGCGALWLFGLAPQFENQLHHFADY